MVKIRLPVEIHMHANIPWLRLDSLERHELSKDAYGYLTEQGS
jgi:hypothetical protein